MGGFSLAVGIAVISDSRGQTISSPSEADGNEIAVLCGARSCGLYFGIFTIDTKHTCSLDLWTDQAKRD